MAYEKVPPSKKVITVRKEVYQYQERIVSSYNTLVATCLTVGVASGAIGTNRGSHLVYHIKHHGPKKPHPYHAIRNALLGSNLKFSLSLLFSIACMRISPDPIIIPVLIIIVGAGLRIFRSLYLLASLSKNLRTYIYK